MQPLVAQAPIATLVNTHSDGDHWWGNQLVARRRDRGDGGGGEAMAQLSPGGCCASAGRRACASGGRRWAPAPDDFATVGRFVGDVLRPFAFDEVRLTRPTRTFPGELALEVGGREVG